MTKNITTWRVPPLAWVPISAAIMAEAVSNALRAYGLGAHLEQFSVTAFNHEISIAGLVLVLAAVAISLSQARAAWVALTPGNARQRIVSGLAATLLIIVSVTAMASHILEAQRVKVSSENGANGAFERTTASFSKAETELLTLSSVRTPQAVQAAMKAAPVSRKVFRRTKQCTDVTRDDSWKSCRPMMVLRQELAKAYRKMELERKVDALTAKLSQMQAPIVKASSDELWVSGIWAWIMGVAVVFIATFGSVVFAKVERVNVPVAKSDTAQSSFSVSDLPSPAPQGPSRPPRGGKPKLVDDQKVQDENSIVTYIRENGPVDSQTQLASNTNVSRGQVSKTVKNLVYQGVLIKQPIQDENGFWCNRISLAA